MAKSASTNYAWAGFFLRGIIGLLPLYLLLLTIEETEAFQSAARDNPYQVLRWLSLKDFEEKERPIDVLILGNSHWTSPLFRS